MKTMIALFLLMLSMTTFAYNTAYSRLIPGKEILIDVAKKDVISLTLETKSKDGDARPKLSLVKQWSGFECAYKQTLLLHSGYDYDNKIYKNTWELQVTWTPGADLSGCILQVSFPGMKDSRASLFMNY